RSRPEQRGGRETAVGLRRARRAGGLLRRRSRRARQRAGRPAAAAPLPALLVLPHEPGDAQRPGRARPWPPQRGLGTGAARLAGSAPRSLPRAGLFQPALAVFV